MSDQLARGLFANFDQSENPFGVPNGMEENLRILDDHLALYTLQAPEPPGSPLPGAPQPGDGQIYTDGTYAVFNDGSWRNYPARLGVRAMLLNGTEAWTNNGAGWSQYSVLDTGAATAIAIAARDGAVAAGAASRSYPNGAAANVPRGLTQAGVGAITPGAGGTNGTFPLAWQGGTGNFSVNPVGTFTVAGNVLTAVTITQAGLCINAAPVAPTPSFAASAGLAGAAVVLTPQVLEPAGARYWVQSADAKSLDLYYNNAGASTRDPSLISIPTQTALLERFGFPRIRDAYGVLNMPNPSVMASAAFNQAVITNDGRFSIPAGVGKVYYSQVSDHIPVVTLVPGDKILFIVELDAASGTTSAPTVLYQPGGVTVNFVNDMGRRWVCELTVPVGGLTSAVVRVTSTDAANPVTGKQLAYAISPANAVPYERQPEARAVEAWVQAGFPDGVGNMWPAEYSNYSVAIGVAANEKTVFGIQIGPLERVFAMLYVESDDGTPAIVDRLWLSASSVIDTPAVVGPSQNAFLSPVAGRPGVYAGWANFYLLTKASVYARVNIDNAQTVAGSYVQKAVVVKKVQVFRRPPASFVPANSMMWRNDGKIFFNNFNGQQAVALPIFAPGTDGKDYWIFQCRRYDKTGDGVGGGVGSVWEEATNARRTDDNVFQPIYLVVDAGLNEFAMKADSWAADQHQGGNVHGGQQRTAPPQLYVDDVLQANPDIQKNFGAVNKVVWIETSQVMDRTTPAVPVADVVITKTWTGRTFTIKVEVEFLQPLNMLTLYAFMYNACFNLGNDAANGQVFNKFTLPDQGGVEYVPGGGVQALYPSEKRFTAISDSLGMKMDVEVISPTTAEFRSWIQLSGITKKFYMSPLGIHDGSGLVAERVARPVIAGETFTLETRMSFSKL